MAQLLLELASPPAPTFDNFVAGSNEAVLHALRSFGTDSCSDRCLYLWGTAGSGRTHLLSAWRNAHGNANAASVHDDVDLLDDTAQMTLFNRINAARDGEGHVLVAGPCSPALLPVRSDLKSRLAWGLALEVLPLTDAEKEAALRQQGAARGMTLHADVLAYLMTHVRRDMTTLAGLIDALDRHSLETKRPITLPLVRELLAQNRTLDL